MVGNDAERATAVAVSCFGGSAAAGDAGDGCCLAALANRFFSASRSAASLAFSARAAERFCCDLRRSRFAAKAAAAAVLASSGWMCCFFPLPRERLLPRDESSARAVRVGMVTARPATAHRSQ